MSQNKRISPIRKLLAANVRAERARRNLTQEQLAAAAHVPQQALSDVERGARNVGIDTVGRLALALHVKPSILLKSADE